MNFFKKRKMKALRKKVQVTHEVREQSSNNATVIAELNAINELVKFYQAHRFDQDLPRADILILECYRLGAALNDPRSQYLCGQQLLELGKFWEAMATSPVFGAEIHKTYARNHYEEALGYLHAAEGQQYALAKRLLGLMNIHGWGTPKNMEQGYKLVLDSIEQEKAWDRATKIFEELKLNSPEFFAALGTYKR